MNRFIIFCTEEQTKKALELGAPIELESEYYNPTENDFKLDNPIPCKSFTNGYHYAKCPTAEQMIGWLETIFKEVNIQEFADFWEYNIYFTDDDLDILHCEHYSSRKEATLAAIDAALDYLKNKKEEEK